MLMDRPSIKRIASACVITVTLLCILLIKADFIAARYSEYHNSVTEASYEPVDIDKIKKHPLTESYRRLEIIAAIIKFPCTSVKFPCFTTRLFQ